MKLFILISATFLAATQVSAAVPYKRQGTPCTTGTYKCFNPVNGSSQILVCTSSYWTLSSICDPGTKCASAPFGGCTCQPT
ncbi:hypothetical protein F4811DRAFT_492553 [Daldinia bambusicola]|nr:hypothetical protein F4811DRAFT_492553 [Daldinia bambusicola]